MVTFPPAKVNLGLRVLRKRPDGYHDLETCMVPVGWCDLLEVIEGDAFSFRSSGRPIPGGAAGNLCVRAYELLRSDFSLPPVQIHLHKIIPMGAGLGRGVLRCGQRVSNAQPTVSAIAVAHRSGALRRATGQRLPLFSFAPAPGSRRPRVPR